MGWIAWTIILAILTIAGVVGFYYLRKGRYYSDFAPWCLAASGAGLVSILVMFFFCVFYTQDPGQASMIVSFSGKVQGD